MCHSYIFHFIFFYRLLTYNGVDWPEEEKKNLYVGTNLSFCFDNQVICLVILRFVWANKLILGPTN